MNDIAAYAELIRDELGISVSPDELDQHLDELESWDSLYLLRLVTAIEGATGERVSIPDVLRATSLREVFEAVSV
jgi:acyl carrier protein